MPRSLRVTPEQIDRVKLALPRCGYAKIEELATDLQMARSTVSHFLNGKAILSSNFLEICRFLNLDWQEVTGLIEEKKPEDSSVLPASPGKDRITIILDIQEKELEKLLPDIQKLLQQISGDTTMTIKKIDPGSVVLIVEGSPQGCKQLKELFSAGKLTELASAPILDMDIETTQNHHKYDRIELRKWLDNCLESGWETVESLLGRNLAIVRLASSPVQQGKMLDLEQKDRVALVIGIEYLSVPQANVWVELFPDRDRNCLPDNLQLEILDENLNTVMQAESQNTSNIRLKFTADRGDYFSLKIRRGDDCLSEHFSV